MKKRQLQIVRLGNLNTIVQERGKNNDDGDGWTIRADEGRRPPTPLRRGLFAFLFVRS